MKSTIKTLSSGLIVANFSSPHNFTFDTGEVLSGVPKEVCNELSLIKKSANIPSECGRFQIAKVWFEMSDKVADELINVCKAVDICIIPFPMLSLILSRDDLSRKKQLAKCHTCFITDRVSKTVSSTIFCR